MGVAQNAMNNITNSLAGAAGVAKSITFLNKQNKSTDIALSALEEENKKQASYSNQMNEIFGEALDMYPQLKEAKYFSRALQEMESRKQMMLALREATRKYRDQFSPGSEEYKRIEAEGLARKTLNFADWRESLKKLGTEKPESKIITPDSPDWNGGK